MMISVPVKTTGRSFGFGNSRTLFEGPYVMEGSDVGGGRSYALAPDGRFLMMKEQKGLEGRSGPTEIVVILNWMEELKRLLASKTDRTR
jgi:hypothetical protein